MSSSVHIDIYIYIYIYIYQLYMLLHDNVKSKFIQKEYIKNK